MEEVLKSILQEQQKTNELLEQMSKPTTQNVSELLSKKDVEKQYGLTRRMVDRLFEDKEFPAQKNVIPHMVAREALEQYLLERHEKVE